MTAARALSGLVFGRLKVVRLDVSKKRRSWVCECLCGTTKVVAQKDIVRGDTRSCGCIKRERLIAMSKHGKVDHAKLTPEQTAAYKKWALMWNRVRNPVGKSKCYATVSVSERWRDFHTFLSDLGPPPRGHSLERVDSAGPYSPENCCWIPTQRQAQNTSRSRKVLYRGEYLCMSEHARRLGLTPDVVFDRVNKLGWTVERAFETPTRKGKKPSPHSR
jgi:hypothetical protein